MLFCQRILDRISNLEGDTLMFACLNHIKLVSLKRSLPHRGSVLEFYGLVVL